MSKNYDSLKLDNQLCFPLYAAAREVVKRYHPFLSEIDLTYTQYVALMVLWEQGQVSVKTLGEKLHLDSGTLTPMLKELEKKGILTRMRSKEDERVLLVTLTEEGERLKDRAVEIPEKMAGCIKLEPEAAMKLYELLYQLLDGMK